MTLHRTDKRAVVAGLHAGPLPARDMAFDRIVVLVALLLLAILADVAWGEVRVALPLEGHYRPGRYMPVRLVGTSHETAPLRIAPTGAVPTNVAVGPGAVDVTIPLLSIDTALSEVPSPGPTPAGAAARPLQPAEALVGHVAGDPQAVAALLPGRTIIPVALDAADPLPGAAVAWEALDALLLDAPAAQRLGERRLIELASAGTIVFVRGETAPDLTWPWQQLADSWFLRLGPSGPAGVISEPAYQPILGWRVERPARYRRLVLLFGILFAAAALGTMLWRSNYAPLVLAGVAIATIALTAAWRHRQAPILHTGGEVIVRHDGFIQRDAWHYQAAIEATGGGFAFQGLTRPALVSPDHLATIDLALHCRGDGLPAAFTYHLPRQARVAFLVRRVGPGPLDAAPARPVTSPMRELLPMLYLRPGQVIAGQLPPDAPQRFPAVVVQGR